MIEVQESGVMNTLRAYGGAVQGDAPGELINSVYLALDMGSSGWLFVANSDRNMMLDAQFKLMATVPMYNPVRMCYDSASRILYVSDANTIYKFQVNE